MPSVKIITKISKESTDVANDIIGNYFDSDWYLKTYPDAKKAIASGKFQNALEHYLEKGTKEKRSPNATFDENYYLNSDESVRRAVEQGHFKSGYHHFLVFGGIQGMPSSRISTENEVAKKGLIDLFEATIDDIELRKGRPSRIGISSRKHVKLKNYHLIFLSGQRISSSRGKDFDRKI